MTAYNVFLLAVLAVGVGLLADQVRALVREAGFNRHTREALALTRPALGPDDDPQALEAIAEQAHRMAGE